jgi:hypothetical protein
MAALVDERLISVTGILELCMKHVKTVFDGDHDFKKQVSTIALWFCSSILSHGSVLDIDRWIDRSDERL